MFSKIPAAPIPPPTAHGHDAVFAIAPLQFADKAGRQLGPGAAQRMPQRHRPAIGVDTLGIQLCFFDDGKACAAKASFNSITAMSLNLESGQFQGFGNGVYGAQSHFLGLIASGAKLTKPRQRLDAQCLRAARRTSPPRPQRHQTSARNCRPW